MTNGTTPTENGVADVAVLAAQLTTETIETSEIAAEVVPAPPSFNDLGLHPDVKQALDDMGYFAPTAVQTAVFKPVSEGKDLMVQSRTGTGKTTAFGLPIINKLLPAHRQPQALILAPTRELALQVARELTNVGKVRGILVEAIYGGAPIGKQITALKDGVHVVVGTPGRVLDHIGRRTLDLKTVQTFVLDECDEMLSMGFLEDIEKIASHLPEKRQTLLFSATMPDEVLRYSRRHMTAPENMSLSRDSVSVNEIHHAYYIVSGIARSRDLLKILFAENPDSAIIFCNTRDETTMVSKFLTKQGLDAEPLSSDLSQADRERVMGRMKAHNLRFLCATDVAARGIDITNLTHVINYSVPEAPEIYVHRTGRTGRAGKKGTALSLVGPRELGNFRYVRLTFGIKPEERLLPKDDIFIGKLKVPLPPIGVPQAPDPVQILIRAVPGTPTDLEKSIFEKLLAKSDGRRVLAALVADKLNQITTRAIVRPVRVERPEGEAREDRPRDDRPREDRPREDRGDRPRFGEDRGGDRPRSDRDRGPRDRGPREGGEQRATGDDRGPRPERGGERDRGDRPRFDRDRGERPRFDRDRGPREDRDAQAPRDAGAPRDPQAATSTSTSTSTAPALATEGAVRDDRGMIRDDRGPREDRASREDRAPREDRPREDRGPREARPEGAPRDDRGPREAREGQPPREDRGDRPRFDRDRGERHRGDRHGRDRDDRPRADVAPVQDATAPAEVVAVMTTTEAPVEARTERADRPERAERTDRPDRGRDRRPERVRVDTETEVVAAPPAKVEDVARAALDRADSVDRADQAVAQAPAKAADKGKRRETKTSEPTEATREFWETWADNKVTREAEAPAAVAVEPAAEERKPRERGGRGRGDKKEARGDKPREKRDTVIAPTLTEDAAPARSKRAETGPAAASDANQARLFVSLGKKHGVSADDLRSLLAGPIGGDTTRIGSVSLRDTHAHVRVPEDLVEAIIAAVHGTQHKEQAVTVERSRA